MNEAEEKNYQHGQIEREAEVKEERRVCRGSGHTREEETWDRYHTVGPREARSVRLSPQRNEIEHTVTPVQG